VMAASQCEVRCSASSAIRRGFYARGEFGVRVVIIRTLGERTSPALTK